MTLQRRRILGAATAAAVLGTPALRARAAETAATWPSKPIRLIVPNVPGGATDILARTLQGELQKLWNQQILVEYKAGGGTVVGTDFVAKSAPDGYTLGMVVTSHVINPSLRKSMPYDTLKDLVHVSLTVTSGVLLSASPKLTQVNNLKELIAYGKANPGKVTYATAGAGSSMHLGGELMKQRAGFDMLHVAYKGAAGAYPDVADGRVDLLIDPLFSSMPHVKSGRLKPIAMLSAKRDPSALDIAAAGETIPDYNVLSVNGVVAPAGTPADIVAKISAGLAQALHSTELRPKLRLMGLDPVGSSPKDFDAFVRAEMKRWEAVVKKGNISVE